MSSIDNKEIMKNLGVGSAVAGLGVGTDYFSGNKVTFWSFGKFMAIGAVGDLINDHIKIKSWYPFKA